MSRAIGLRQMPSPPVITFASRCAPFPALRTAAAAVSGISPWSDAANTVLAFPFVIEADTTFYKVFWLNGSGTIGGTRDVAIYSEDFTFIVGTGAATSATGPSAIQTVALTATTTLPPGLYYAGMGCSVTTTNNQVRWSFATLGIPFWMALGCWKTTDANPINLDATPADLTNIAFPVFGLITRSVFDV